MAENRYARLNETWDMGELIDLSGDIYTGMWHLPDPYPPVEVKEIPLVGRFNIVDYNVYAQEVRLAGQTSTYLETAAHMYPEREKINEVGLERLFVPAVVLRIPRGREELITAADMETALATTGETVRPGDALLIATGWDSHWDEPDFTTHSPHFRYSAVEWVVKHGCSILGSDAANWSDPGEKPSFFPMFFQSDTLLLAPLVNLAAIPVPRIRLIVLPLRIRGACASPCRAIAVVPR
ncbi:MAG: cyclase family protein [Anaerolineae bacterium]